METIVRAGLGNAASVALLAIVVAGLGRFLGRYPAVRHGLWVLVLVKLVTPPLEIVPVAWLPPLWIPPHEATSDALIADGPVAQRPDANAMRLEPRREASGMRSVPRIRRAPMPADAPWRVVAVIWLSGTGMVLATGGLRIRRWQRILSLAKPAADLREDVEALSSRLGLRRPPSAWWVPGAVSPMLWSMCCRPRLIVPEELWQRLEERQRATLLVHELAHLRRGDHRVRWLELVATALFWWLPVVWIARRALHEAEEQCCDAWVVWACPDAARAYAETLLETVDFLTEARPGLPLAASGIGHVRHLKRRMIMIMQGSTPRAMSRTGVLAILGLSAMLLPMTPTWGQRAEEAVPHEGGIEAERAVVRQRSSDEKQRVEEIVRSIKAAEALFRSHPNGQRERAEVAGRIAELRNDLRSANEAGSLYLLKKGERLVAEEKAVANADAARALVEELLVQGKPSDEQATLEDGLRRQLDKARAEVEALNLQLRVKRIEQQQAEKQFHEAQDRLSQLQRASMDSSQRPTTFERRLFRRDLGISTSDRERRLVEIEKKLEELMGEVRSLKEVPGKPGGATEPNAKP